MHNGRNVRVDVQCDGGKAQPVDPRAEGARDGLEVERLPRGAGEHEIVVCPRGAAGGLGGGPLSMWISPPRGSASDWIDSSRPRTGAWAQTEWSTEMRFSRLVAAGASALLVTGFGIGFASPASADHNRVWTQQVQRASEDAPCDIPEVKGEAAGWSAWAPSWAQWPNRGEGGWICTRSITWATGDARHHRDR